PAEAYAQPDSRIAFWDRLSARLATLPGVESVAIGSHLPTRRVARGLLDAEGATSQEGWLTVGPGYFRTLGAGVLAGRDFADLDGGPGRETVVVNQLFASQHWPGGSALGRRLRFVDGDAQGPWMTIAGVVSNVSQSGQTATPLIYLPYRERPDSTM